MVSMQQGLRNLVIIAVLAGGLVALVLGAGLLGLALCVFGVWQLTLVLRAKPGLLVDQRWADREGKPRIRSK